MDKRKKILLGPGLVAIIFILLKLSARFGSDIITNGDRAYLALIFLQMLIFVLPAILYCKLRPPSFTESVKMRALSPDKIPITVLAALILLLGSAIIKLLLCHLGVELASYSLYSYSVPQGGGGFAEVLYVLTVFAIIPALTEEFVFRGVLQAEYEDFGIVLSILIPALLFSMLHFSLSTFVIYLFGGAVLGFTAYITKSLIAPMLLHMINNVFGIFVESYIWDVFARPENIVFVIFILLALFLMFLIFFLSEAERILYNLGLSNEPSPSGPRTAKKWFLQLRQILLSPTFIICFVIFILSVCKVI